MSVFGSCSIKEKLKSKKSHNLFILNNKRNARVRCLRSEKNWAVLNCLLFTFIFEHFAVSLVFACLVTIRIFYWLLTVNLSSKERDSTS